MTTPLPETPEAPDLDVKAPDMFGAECLRVVRHLEMLTRHNRTGPLAELRRLVRRGDGPPPEAFWSLVTAARVVPSRESLWEALAPLMVACPHRRGKRLGLMLRSANVAPARVERWLRLDGDDARVELRKLIRRVDTVDWVDLSRLMRVWADRERGDHARRSLARDFFLGRPAANAASATTTSPQPRA